VLEKVIYLRKLLTPLAFCSVLFSEVITLDNIEVQESEINTPSFQVSELQAQKTRSITLTDKLEQDISFNKTSIGNGNEGISFRGLDFKATEYVEDGIPMYRSTGGLIDTNFNMTNANILINDGSGVSSTGVTAMGGEVEISSKVPTKELEVKVGTTVSTNDEFYYTTLSSAIESYYIQADASYYHRSDWELSDDFSPTSTQGKGKRINSDKEQKNFSLKVGTFINDSLHVAAKASISKADYGLEPNIYAQDLPYWSNYTKIDPKELHSYYIYVDYDYQDYEFSLRAYYDDYEDKYVIYDDVTYTNTWPVVTYDDSRLGSIVKATKKTNSSKTSFIFLSEQNKHIRFGGGREKGTSKLNTFKPSLLHVEQLNDMFELEAGISYTIMKEHEASGIGAAEKMDDKETIDGQLKLSYKENKSTLYISGARKSRMPSMSEMFKFSTRRQPNPNVKPERSWQYSAGYKYNIENKSNINFDIYYYDVEDLIVNSNNGYINKNGAEHYGAELRVNTKEFKKHYIRASYAYAHAVDDNNNDLTLIPNHKVILQDTISITEKMNAFLSYTYISSQCSYNFPSDLDNPQKIDAYNLFDAQVSYTLKDKLSARVGVKNIADENYEWQYGFPAEGRSFYISLELQL